MTTTTPKKRAAPKKRRDWKPAFLEAFAKTGMVSEAVKVAGISRGHAYLTRQQDETFALAWADVEEASTEELENVAVKRAKNGSDVLLIFLLKSRRPEVYRDIHRHEITGKDGKPIEQEMSYALLENEDTREAAAEFARTVAAARRQQPGGAGAGD